jgi:hypothetical protein
MCIAGETEIFGAKSAPVSLCPPQIPHEFAWDRTRAVAMGRRRLTSLDMAPPSGDLVEYAEPFFPNVYSRCVVLSKMI